MEIGLQLLMSDGVLQITFRPKLSLERYGELLEMAKLRSTKEELRVAVQLLAQRWGNEVIVSDL